MPKFKRVLAAKRKFAPLEAGFLMGFTLIELLVVIAIIGVLTSIVLVSLHQARIRSRDSQRLGTVRQIQNALELYYGAHSQYPMAAQQCSPGNGQYYGLEQLVAEGYLPSVPRDPNPPPSWTCHIYATYNVPGQVSGYHFAVFLENTSHRALDSDRDCSSRVTEPAPPLYIPCDTATAYLNGFDGHEQLDYFLFQGTRAVYDVTAP